MAEFRQIHTRIWKDNWFSELEPDAKLLFIYLFSNEQAEIAGVYELPVKYMAFEVGVSKERALDLLSQFELSEKVYYRNNWVWVVNLRKYNETASDKVRSRIDKDLESLPDGELKKLYCEFHNIPYRYPIDTLSILETKPETGIDTRLKNDSETETETIQKQKGNRPRAKAPRDPLLDHQAVVTYREVAKSTPNEEQRKLLAEIDLANWEVDIRHWLKHGWSKFNIASMVEFHKNGGERTCSMCNKSNGNGHHAEPPLKEIPADELARRRAAFYAAPNAGDK